MATGDQNDITNRLSQIVPPSWFPSGAANVNALLQGFAGIASWLYSLIVFAKTQTRIATASGFFLDLMSFDFFGRAFPRRSGESDALFSAGIRAELIRARGTRAGLVRAVTDLTGTAPAVFEPTKPSDTGGYGYACGYSMGGGYGSMSMPFQCFVTAYRPSQSGIPFVPGYDTQSTASGFSIGGYGVALAYGSLSQIVGAVTDAQIYGRIASVAPVGTVPWTQLESAIPAAPTPPSRLAAMETGAATDFGNASAAPVEYADYGNCTSGTGLIIDLGTGA